MVSLPKTISTPMVLGLVLLATVGTAAAAVTIVTVNPNPMNPGSGTVQSSADLTLDSQDLVYSGTDVTGTDVTVTNSATSDHTADIQVTLKDSNGNIIATKTSSSVTLTGSTSTTTTVSFDSTHSMDSFSTVDVVVEQTA